MKLKFRLYRRGRRYYAQNNETGQQVSLHTSDKTEATRLLNAMNEAPILMGTNMQGPRVDYSHYAVSCFVPHLFSLRSGSGCGPSALGLLTGVAPDQIKRRHNEAHYSDRFMTTFLGQHGFEVLKLNQCIVSRNDSFIGASHVILISQLFSTNEGTWGVIFGGAYFHNFRVYVLDELSMLNKPIMSAYLVCDPRFRLAKKLPHQPAKPGKAS